MTWFCFSFATMYMYAFLNGCKRVCPKYKREGTRQLTLSRSNVVGHIYTNSNTRHLDWNMNLDLHWPYCLWYQWHAVNILEYWLNFKQLPVRIHGFSCALVCFLWNKHVVSLFILQANLLLLVLVCVSFVHPAWLWISCWREEKKYTLN